MKSERNDGSAPVPKTAVDRVRLKVCGVTLPAQAAELRRLGVDLLGLNFHPDSPRYVDPELAARIVDAWGDPVSTVGVFVDRSAEEVLETLRSSNVRIAQLHGDEPTETVVAIARHVPVIRAFRVRDASSLANARAHIEAIEKEGIRLLAVLIDGYTAGAHGGTGQTVAENLVRSSGGLHPRVMLAGGLKPGNLAERLLWMRPWCVDVASGVETAPGIKDLSAVDAMARCIRETCGKKD